VSEFDENDTVFMEAAIDEARAASVKNEVAVGAVAVFEGKIIARAHNTKETSMDPTAHAEITVLRRAAKARGTWRLTGVTVYSTLEPCPMCAGAMVLASIDWLVYGANDPKMGAVRSLFEIADDERLNHCIEIKGGVLDEKCAGLLRSFFSELRSKSKVEP